MNQQLRLEHLLSPSEIDCPFEDLQWPHCLDELNRIDAFDA